MSSKYYAPGEAVPLTGLYVLLTSMRLRTRSKLKLAQGDSFPETSFQGYAYQLVKEEPLKLA